MRCINGDVVVTSARWQPWQMESDYGITTYGRHIAMKTLHSRNLWRLLLVTSVQDREKLWPNTCCTQARDTLVEPLLPEHEQQQASPIRKSEMPSAKALQDFAASVETVKSLNGAVKSSTATDKVPPLNIVLLVSSFCGFARHPVPPVFVIHHHRPRTEQRSAPGKLALPIRL